MLDEDVDPAADFRPGKLAEATAADGVSVPHIRPFLTAVDRGRGWVAEHRDSGSEDKPCPQEAST